jgi:hypothetical protein
VKLVVSAVVLAHIPFDADVMMSKKLLSALMDVGRSRSGLMKQCCGSRRGYVHRTAAAGEGGRCSTLLASSAR